MLLYIFKQVIKTSFQLPTPILLWMISRVGVYSQEKYDTVQTKAITNITSDHLFFSVK